MIMKWNDNMKDMIKKFLRKFPLSRKAFIEWEHRRIEEGIEKKRLILRENGNKLISDIQQCLQEIEDIAFFDYGTLLGIIREGKIISHDLDADFGVNIKDDKTIKRVRNSLNGKGIILKSYNVLDSGLVVQDTFEKYGVEFDAYYHYKDPKNPESDKTLVYMLFREPEKSYVGDRWDVAIAISEAVEDITSYPFQGFMVSVPKDYEKHLKYRYGENWRIPDRSYVYWNWTNTHPCKLKGRIIECKEENKL